MRGVALTLSLFLVGCGLSTGLEYTIPDNYTGFLVIEYDCVNGTPVERRNGQVHITFQDSGRFVSVDPFAGWQEQPYSLNVYQYAYSNPVLLTDPSGKCIAFLQYSPAFGTGHHADLFMDDCSGCECQDVDVENKWKEHPYVPCRTVTVDNKGTQKLAVMYAGSGPQFPGPSAGGSGGNLVPTPERTPGGALDNDHPWGDLRMYVSDMGTGDEPGETGMNDITRGAESVKRLLLLNDDTPCDRYYERLKNFATLVSTDPDWKMTYNPFLRNSNGMLHAALKHAGFPRIPNENQHGGLSVPGWDEDLTDPKYFWPQTVNSTPYSAVYSVPYKRSERGVR